MTRWIRTASSDGQPGRSSTDTSACGPDSATAGAPCEFVNVMECSTGRLAAMRASERTDGWLGWAVLRVTRLDPEHRMVAHEAREVLVGQPVGSHLQPGAGDERVPAYQPAHELPLLSACEFDGMDGIDSSAG